MVSLNSHDRQLPDSVSDAFEHLATFDLDHIAGSQLVGVAREAFRLGDVDFLCFGESDHPSPVCAQTALKQALDAGTPATRTFAVYRPCAKGWPTT